MTELGTLDGRLLATTRVVSHPPTLQSPSLYRPGVNYDSRACLERQNGRGGFCMQFLYFAVLLIYGAPAGRESIARVGEASASEGV